MYKILILVFLIFPLVSEASTIISVDEIPSFKNRINSKVSFGYSKTSGNTNRYNINSSGQVIQNGEHCEQLPAISR